MSKSSAQRVRDCRKREREEQDHEEFRHFLIDTPFTLWIMNYVV